MADRAAVFQPEFIEDLIWRVQNDRKVAIRVLVLVKAILRDPYKGIGKPEQLRFVTAGTWSRRLTQEHRIVYLVRDERIDILQTRYHYLG
jgi:toxin YoeB